MKLLPLVCLLLTPLLHTAQDFYFGADMSYVNELEDCGVRYHEAGIEKDPYTIFEAHDCNLVRLRLWHTPAWYDDLNNGNRYSDLADVKRAITRAKQHNMQVLLDFHLSDNWADPNKQLVPAAWLPIVDDIPTLSDSLYNYIFQTLTTLQAENLLPELVQIGNETNKGILLSPEDNAGWTLDWLRNATLFNRAIQAVRDVEEQHNKDIKIVLHLADPERVDWYVSEFIRYGVRDFDIIGISYYWAWHQPTSISETGEVVVQLRTDYPDKAVLIVETGYIWTTGSNDTANNIINSVHPDYSPASPSNQRDWLIAMTQEVRDKGAVGVVYWEPCWVSSDCSTQWGRGSHQEHASFFDFDNNLLLPGGIEWMTYDYSRITTTETQHSTSGIEIIQLDMQEVIIQHYFPKSTVQYQLVDTLGKVLLDRTTQEQHTRMPLGHLPSGTYVLRVQIGKVIETERILVH